MRVEYLWREEGFAAAVPFHGSGFIQWGPKLDQGLLRDAVAFVISLHEVLHAHLQVDGGRALLVTDEVKTPDLEIVDVSRAEMLSHWEGGGRSALREFVEKPINLLAEPAFRCRLFRDEDGNFTLGTVLHHYFSDGWSAKCCVDI